MQTSHEGNAGLQQPFRSYQPPAYTNAATPGAQQDVANSSGRHSGGDFDQQNIPGRPALELDSGFSQHNVPGPSAVKDETTALAPDGGGKSEKPKQKRNKPTLSCLECVERKTKCDRSRPCIACVKRQSNCKYTAVANLIANADRTPKSPSSKARYIKPPAKLRKLSQSSQSQATTSPMNSMGDGWATSIGLTSAGPTSATSTTYNPSQTYGGRRSFSSVAGPGGGSSPYLLSNVPYSKSSPSNVFGVGSQHPFSNYWTCAGGLPEVISVMPSREQADILVNQYFESVDPVYPFIHRRTFYADYERFWNMPIEEKNESDAAMLALHYAIYALGTQFVQSSSFKERSQTAEFYASAANQSLRIYSYLNRTSMRAIQAMLLMAYFLMNDNHASDAYAWAGIHLRQAYAMRLHRDPEISVPGASILEKQQRRKLWQAVFFQDTFLTVLLKLPPTATHSDVPVEDLSDAAELAPSHNTEDALCTGAHSRVENLMSISVIAPPVETYQTPRAPPQPHHLVDPQTSKNDVAYLRSMWLLGNLVQDSLSSPLSLSLPLAKSPRRKDDLVAAFKRLYKDFPSALKLLDPAAVAQLAATNPRQARQNLFVTSNYYHCLMLLQASENPKAGVECNVRGALESAHEALGAFFKLWNLFESEASVWWVFQFGAFEEGLAAAHLLALTTAEERLAEREKERGGLFERTREDVVRLLGLLESGSGSMDMHRSRKEVLAQALERVGW